MAGTRLVWALAAIVATLLALGVFLVVWQSGRTVQPIEVKLPDAPAADGVLKVYITGAVAQPGIYQVQAGDRYADALALAGGPSEDAEPLAVNMARRVRDEDHIHVPRRGEVPPGLLASGESIVDLNTATIAQLEALPGIGPVRAQQIVESRVKQGAFTRPEDLVQRKLLPQSMFETVRERLQVRP